MKHIQIRLAGPEAEVAAARQLIERALGERVRFGLGTTDKQDESRRLVYGRVYVAESAPAERKEGA